MRSSPKKPRKTRNTRKKGREHSPMREGPFLSSSLMSFFRVFRVLRGFSPRFEQAADELAQFRPVARVGQGELEERLEIALEVADVEAAFVGRQADAKDLAALGDQRPDGVG